MKKICIVTTRHVSYNPRVLKEADAFFGRGYGVTVVTVSNHPAQRRFDELLMRERRWQLKTVNFCKEGEKRRWLFLSLKQKLFLFLSKLSFRFGIAERAALKAYDALAKLAGQEKADVYIAHHAEALGAACRAAKKNNAGFGFDAEDFHTGMTEPGGAAGEEALVEFLESKYLPHCTYFTAASKGIGEAYASKYGIKKGQTILNVFPKAEVGERVPVKPLCFYWYSQVIGPHRSLETLLAAAAQLQEPFQIHLRGSFGNDAYRETLEKLVADYGLDGRVFFHPPLLAEHLIADAARYDVGLALESAVSVNRNICVTNKLFSYLMSGLAVIGTDTEGQKEIFAQLGKAGLLCRQDDAADLARAMRYFLQQPDRLIGAQRAARLAAEQRFNWEREAEKLIAGFERRFSPEKTAAGVV